MVTCGNFATSNQALCDSTSTQNADCGLLRMMSSMTYWKNETLTTTDIPNAFLNPPISKDKTISVAVPEILTRLGVVKASTIWG
eukprot:723953-Prorocentrum_lima.AAC.1